MDGIDNGLKIQVLLECGLENNDYDDSQFELIAKTALSHLGLFGSVVIELSIIEKAEMQALNFEARKIDKATDVLSFPFLSEILPFNKENYPLDYDTEAKAVFLGSIVLCDEIAREQAEEFGHSIARERAYLFLHGVLHLLSFDHIDEADKKKMRQAEEEILNKLDILR